MNNWRSVVLEQLAVLHRAGWTGEINVGFSTNGHVSEVGFVVQAFSAVGIPLNIRVTDKLNNFEFPILEKLWEDAQNAGAEDVYGYFHTKGVSCPTEWSKMHWRLLMNAACLYQWRQRIQDITVFGNDASGTSIRNPDIQKIPRSEHYSGNFWWARATLFKGATSPNETRKTYREGMIDIGERIMAEVWIGRCEVRRWGWRHNEFMHFWSHKWWGGRSDLQMIGLKEGSILA